MDSIKKAYFQLHISVLLWGFTAILGKLISISALTLVWWRMSITTVCLFAILLIMNKLTKLSTLNKTIVYKVMGIGCLVALHWLAFYGAIKLANASVAVICISTMSLFTAILEPLIRKTAFRWSELFIGIAIIPAMILIVNHLDTNMTLGIVVGLLAAALAASFSILNKIMLQEIEPLPMTFIEIGSGALFLSIFMPFFIHQNPNLPLLLSGEDCLYLVLLSVFCTVIPYIMSLAALQKLNPFTVALSINLEPIYTIVLAWLLLQEDKQLNVQFYLGVAIIIISVFLEPLLKKYLKSSTD
jgi:drug/metabolite transporter (DMT)-like permease